MRIAFTFFLVILPTLAFAQDFNWAKKQLIKLYQTYPTNEFYCDCPILWQNNKAMVDLAACGYEVRKNATRANRIEWEHVMPAHNFGHQLLCWQEGGRKNCKKDSRFNLMEGDLHNLQPAIGEVNGDRSNYRYSLFTNKFEQYGQCQMAIDFKERKVQPREQIRGVIARTYLYMEKQYGIKLSKQDKQLMDAWNKRYAPDKWECQRNNIIKSVQGNDNVYITKRCQ